MTRAALWERIGPERITALAQAWHDRATADSVVGHAFSHGFSPDHDEMDERAEACFVAAAHDVELPQDICDELPLASWS